MAAMKILGIEVCRFSHLVRDATLHLLRIYINTVNSRTISAHVKRHVCLPSGQIHFHCFRCESLRCWLFLFSNLWKYFFEWRDFKSSDGATVILPPFKPVLYPHHQHHFDDVVTFAVRMFRGFCSCTILNSIDAQYGLVSVFLNGMFVVLWSGWMLGRAFGSSQCWIYFQRSLCCPRVLSWQHLKSLGLLPAQHSLFR